MPELRSALRMVEAATEAAGRLGIAVTAVVMDASAQVVALGRMPGAFLSTGEVARKKAFTALNFGAPTHEMMERIQPIEYQLVVMATDPRLTFIKGGLPLRGSGGALEGSIGVSGGTGEQDMECCQAALDALGA